MLVGAAVKRDNLTGLTTSYKETIISIAKTTYLSNQENTTKQVTASDGAGGSHPTIPASRVVCNKQFPTIEYGEFEELQKKHYPNGVHCAVFAERCPETRIIQERGYEDTQGFILPENKKLNFAFLDDYVRLADVNNKKINKKMVTSLAFTPITAQD